MSEAFGKDRRLAQKAEFRRVHTQGRRYSTPWFSCHVFDTGQTQRPSRLGITASKKVGLAHDRNRYKRWAREVFRRQSIRGGLEIVVRFHPTVKMAGYVQFENALVRVFEKARLFVNHDCSP